MRLGKKDQVAKREEFVVGLGVFRVFELVKEVEALSFVSKASGEFFQGIKGRTGGPGFEFLSVFYEDFGVKEGREMN